MKIRVLGCHGGELRKHRTTCFLLDGKLCVDAGAITAALDLPEILAIDDIFLTHSHFDHVKDVPLMSDLLVGGRKSPVVVHGPLETMEAMSQDVFNNRVWPDFRVIPSADNPVIAFNVIPVNQQIVVKDYRITAIPVQHPVYSVGYIVENSGSAIAFSGDTGPTEELWKAINRTPNVKAVFVELSFPNSLQWLADISGHLTPSTVMNELRKLDRRGARIYLYHLKPAVIAEVKKEVADLGQDYLQICELDDEYAF
ncbi:MAG TPA: 3',5'-cyclic-nucleotide phosphodiesterase [Myxococcales bacterium]|jgi:ribonuclease BN (tRNA processing enzyme)|nr:3',5'-cyclic-nucleotide phosphodiesterase [Myxococcales bacterium]